MNYKTLEFNEIPDSMFTFYHPIGKEFSNLTYIAIKHKGDHRQTHIQIQDDLQGKGIAVDLIKAIVYRRGFVEFWHGRIINPNLYKVIEKIKTDSCFLVEDEGDYIVINER